MEKKRQQNIKQTIRKNYGKIALEESSGGACCAPGCCSSPSPAKAATDVGYDTIELGSVPEASVLGVGCGAPVRFAGLQKGETVVDLGSGAGIDVFLSANKVGGAGRVIGIDMTEEMLERARRNAKKGGYANAEFRKGDIEERIPVDGSSADAVISNCVINLTTDKVKAFREIRRILKDGGRMVISDLVADRKADSIDPEMWASCIDGALAKDDYLASIRKAGFKEISVLEERQFMDGEPVSGRKITSIVVRAVK
jgi:ubiquinone/menaquinone biosynthesis C-methylase UbiE